ncbi:ZmpA/ZmpB/ZmpC family metallo-endopeptidase, partial [Streptococcus marimammalium]|uniref:ZmpA/ZmpB/ZmpC family metallo-endopeptidase n=1 Tax=Streptococcus marimammalium TaxID=269666 RepID=UPI00047843A3
MREKKQQFSIKKLTTGVASICIGFSFLIVQVSADDTVNDSKITNIHQQIGEYEKIELNDKLDQVISENQENEIVHDLNIENQDAIESSKDLSQELDVDINKIDILENSNTNISLETNEKKSNPLTQFFKVQESMDKSQNAIDFIDGNVTEFSDEIVIEQLNATKKVALKNLLLSDFEKTAPEIAIRDFTKKKQSSKDFKPQEITKYFSPIIIKLRQEAQKSQENFDNMALIQQAWEMAIQKANEELYDDYHLASLAQKAKKNFQNILMPTNNEGILESQPHLTIKQLKQDLHQLFRGILFLQEQYSFEEDLPQRLVFSPESIGAIKKGPETAYQRLLSYGARVNDKRQMALSLNETHFKTHKIGQYTGTSSPIDLFEKLAIEKHKDPSSYFEERTEALVGASRGNNVYSSIKNHKSHYLLPILSQGKGLYIAGTSNSITIGLIATYTKDYPEIENYFHQRGSEQINEPFFNDIVNYQENWLQFLDTVKKPGTQVPFTEALDSMYIYHKDGTRTWSSNEGDLADIAVVHFFNPMRLWQSYSKSGVGLGGQKQSASSIRSFETLFMAKDLSGLGLFTHEMTHANDEERLFGGKYNEHGRRSGQGPEVYARGLFEDIDNTQEGKDGEFKPVFSLNTTIPIGNKTNRVQASQPQNTRIKLETYMKNLMDLVAYLEVKEAEAALNVLSPREKNIYFNHIEQVSAINDSERQQLGSHQTSSNDAIIPFDKATDNIQLGNPMTIEDLVEKNAVSGQFIATGTSPFILNLKHNQYNQVPLLESFYGSQVALDGKNTVGDISFKRHAYEILGWKGWDAFVDYLSDKYNSDQAAFASILKGSYNNQWIQFKKERYQQLAQKKPIQNLWDDQLLLEDLKIAVIKDLAEIKKIKDISSEIFENSSISDSEKQTQLAVIAARQQFYKKATNVRAVKLNILQKALAFNDLTSAILSSPITSVPLVSPQALDLPTADIRYEEIDYDTREILDPSL